MAAKTWEVLAIVTKIGDSGDAVRAVQSQLVSKGYSLTIDGIFGPATERAVKGFQTSCCLTADGIVTADTWNELVK